MIKAKDTRKDYFTPKYKKKISINQSNARQKRVLKLITNQKREKIDKTKTKDKQNK